MLAVIPRPFKNGIPPPMLLFRHFLWIDRCYCFRLLENDLLKYIRVALLHFFLLRFLTELAPSTQPVGWLWNQAERAIDPGIMLRGRP